MLPVLRKYIFNTCISTVASLHSVDVDLKPLQMSIKCYCLCEYWFDSSDILLIYSPRPGVHQMRFFGLAVPIFNTNPMKFSVPHFFHSAPSTLSKIVQLLEKRCPRQCHFGWPIKTEEGPGHTISTLNNSGGETDTGHQGSENEVVGAASTKNASGGHRPLKGISLPVGISSSFRC